MDTLAKVLVVDDDESIRDLLAMVLENVNTHVYLAATGEEAMQVLEDEPIDLIVLDIILPDTTGVQLCSTIKGNPKTALIPVIIMSGDPNHANGLEGLGQGAIDFMAKPFNLAAMQARVRNHLKTKRVRDAEVARLASAREKAEEEGRQSRDLLQSLMEHSTAAITIKDTEGRYLQANRHFQKTFGGEHSSVEGLSDFDLFDLRTAESFRSNDRLVAETRHPLQLEETMELGGSHRCFLSVVFPLLDPSDQLYAVGNIMTDITELKRYEQQLTFLARHDSLTGLFSRSYWNQLLDDALAHGVHGVVFYLDLDRFKVINDTLGHAAGDRALQHVSLLVKREAPEAASVARFGGDEFVVLMPGATEERALVAAQQFQEAIAKTAFIEQENTFHLTFSLGIAHFTPEIHRDEILARADIASYAAKLKGGGRSEVYRPGQADLARLRSTMDWSRRLADAFEQNWFEVWFQPIVNVQTLQPEFYEALVRLKTPEGQYTQPDEFLSAAERLGLMPKLDRHIVQLCVRWLASNPSLRLSINLSSEGIDDPSIVSWIRDLFLCYEVDPARVHFELTEHAVVSCLAKASDVMERLRSIGFGIAIDDFGTGFSSLSYLRRLPADWLKLSGEFAPNLVHDRVNQTIIRSMREVASLLNMRVVLEVIEDEPTLQMVRQLGLDAAQGYYFQKPLHPEMLGFRPPINKTLPDQHLPKDQGSLGKKKPENA
jgi:diguanylate cyclase (GGDEF)-like protein/PAS domain S-box-containing protein